MSSDRQGTTRLTKFRDRKPREKTILFFSPDLDFCISFRMLFQEEYNIRTMTDTTMLTTSIRVLQPDLFVADLSPTDHFRCWLSQMKDEIPLMKTLLLFVPSSNGVRAKDLLREVDDILRKPVNLLDLRNSVGTLMKV